LLDSAAAGEPVARFLVDTWVGFGLEVGAIGIALLVFSRRAQAAIGLVWAVIAIEVARGIVFDVYMFGRGHDPKVFAPWFVIHGVIIVTGLLALRRSSS
jgi:hypothetical protein